MILRKGLLPNKRLGQNFLVNQGIIKKIIVAAALTKTDTVLEIGPGHGALTFTLAKEAGKVVAIEKDRALAEILRNELAERNITNVEIIEGDILSFLDDPHSPLPPRYHVVANIPYYLTSALIRQLLELTRPPERILLTIQKEVAQRIAAHSGKESILSLAVKFYADARILFPISRGSFSPVPNVDSAVIEIIPRKESSPIPPKAFFAVMKAGFLAPRKKLPGNLAKGLSLNKEKIVALLSELGINPNARPEQLALVQWISLAQHLQAHLA
ncbi:MAG: 16S rRNA (adenine(1518)-N(6)/adenine(1519)-N(6))-dimethyltransferase RsmA [Candidatus Azambacteria bacterium]|nr:16S rRNA (adenine(1518)-N(6)/adenine(1519)-N(6))-dimethyltransferase RsmA [Candidatus Azambacteria bacterium]